MHTRAGDGWVGAELAQIYEWLLRWPFWALTPFEVLVPPYHFSQVKNACMGRKFRLCKD